MADPVRLGRPDRSKLIVLPGGYRISGGLDLGERAAVRLELPLPDQGAINVVLSLDLAEQLGLAVLDHVVRARRQLANGGGR